MTTVSFRTEGERITGFTVAGHSGCAEAGEDLLCAAVTSAVRLTECAVNDVLGLGAAVKVKEKDASISLKLPGALGQFFSSLRISASYAVVGAVIAEWLGGFGGLGVYMTRVKKAFAFDKMFAVIILISAISLLLMWAVERLQKKCMPWENSNRD